MKPATTFKYALVAIAAVAALAIAPLAAFAQPASDQPARPVTLQVADALSLMADDYGGIINQTGYEARAVTISWNVPDKAAQYTDEFEMLEYRAVANLNGRKVAETVVDKPVGNLPTSCRITGLEPNTAYEVTLYYTYWFRNGANSNPEADARVTNAYGTSTVYTTRADMTAPSNWKYGWVGSQYGSNLRVKVPGCNGLYEVQYDSGPKPKNLSTSKTIAKSNQISRYANGSLITGTSESFTKKTKASDTLFKAGVATVSMRPITEIKNDDGTYKKTVCGNWRSKTVVPDPEFSADRVWGSTQKIKVAIKPVKHAYQYDIYVGRVTGSKTDPLNPSGVYPKIKGLKKVATVDAKPGKTVKKTITKYNKKNLQFNSNQYIVQVVTKSNYGKSSCYGYKVLA